MKDIFATDQKAGPNNIPQRYVEYTSINVGITKFNDNAAITGLLGYREGVYSMYTRAVLEGILE